MWGLTRSRTVGLLIIYNCMKAIRAAEVVPSRMGEHEVSLENMGNMENMEYMEKMENINQMNHKSHQKTSEGEKQAFFC